MSLINDALKRAKAAQENEAAAGLPPMEFRHVEPGQNRPERPVWLIVTGCFAAMIIGVLVLKAFTSNQTTLKVEAKGVAAATNAQPADASSAPPANRGVPPPAPEPTTYQPRAQELAVAVA